MVATFSILLHRVQAQFGNGNFEIIGLIPFLGGGGHILLSIKTLAVLNGEGEGALNAHTVKNKVKSYIRDPFVILDIKAINCIQPGLIFMDMNSLPSCHVQPRYQFLDTITIF